MNVRVGFGSEGDWGLGIRDWVTKSKNYVRYKLVTFLNAEERGEPALLLEGFGELTATGVGAASGEEIPEGTSVCVPVNSAITNIAWIKRGLEKRIWYNN